MAGSSRHSLFPSNDSIKRQLGELHRLKQELDQQIIKGDVDAKTNLYEVYRAIDDLGQKFLLEWEKRISRADLIVISVGSADEVSQQVPTFALLSNQRFAVLNIDQGFGSNESELSNLPEISYLPMNLDASRNDSKITPNTASTLNEIFMRQFEQNKKIILVYHTWAFGYGNFRHLILNNQDFINKQLFVIGSYHAPQPVVFFSKEGILNLFTNSSMCNKMRDILDTVYVHAKVFTENEIQALNSENSNLINDAMTFFANLSEVNFERIQAIAKTHVDPEDQKTSIIIAAINRLQQEYTLPDRIVDIAIRYIDNPSLNLQSLPEGNNLGDMSHQIRAVIEEARAALSELPVPQHVHSGRAINK
jgi:hypothetical protein